MPIVNKITRKYQKKRDDISSKRKHHIRTVRIIRLLQKIVTFFLNEITKFLELLLENLYNICIPIF